MVSRYSDAVTVRTMQTLGQMKRSIIRKKSHIKEDEKS